MKIICIGDSLTKGYGVLIHETWVGLLNENKEVEFINKGINGDTSGGMLARFQKDVINEKPGFAMIMGGANDIVSGSDLGIIQSNMMSMVHQAYYHGITPIIGISTKADLETFRRDWAELISANQINSKISKYRNWVLKFCKIFNVLYIDFYKEFDEKIQGNNIRYYLDGLHPTKEGHRILADIACQKLFDRLQ